MRDLDLASGRTGILLSRRAGRGSDASPCCAAGPALGITCDPDAIEEGPTQLAPAIQFWNYPALPPRQMKR